MVSERRVRLFRNGKSQAVRIPRDFELPGKDAVMRKEGERLIVEPVPTMSLLEVLAGLTPNDDTLPEIQDPTCNEAQADVLGLPDPCSVSFRECIEIEADGRAVAKNSAGRRLCDVLRMNSPANLTNRSRWIRILELARSSDAALFEELMGFPAAPPDLRSKNAPSNNKPESVANCYFALRERGELPVIS